MIDTFITYGSYLLGALILVGLVYSKIIQKTGEKKIFQKKLDEAETGWGVTKLKEVTKENFDVIFKYKKIDRPIFCKRVFFIGFERIGKIYKMIEVDKKFIVILLKRGLIFRKTDYFIFKNNEISGMSKKCVYFKSNNLTNLQGIYTTLTDLIIKDEFLKNIVNKEIVDDTIGRIQTISSSVVFYDLQHTKESGLLEQRAEIFKNETQQKNKRMWDN